MFIILETGGVDLGAFQTTAVVSLEHIMLNLYIKGTVGGNETLRINLYGNTRFSTPVVSSDWVTLSEITDLGTGNWLGFVRFDFDGYTINPNNTYRIKIESADYTRDAETYYIGALLDYNPRLYTTGTDLGVYMAIIGGGDE